MNTTIDKRWSIAIGAVLTIGAVLLGVYVGVYVAAAYMAVEDTWKPPGLTWPSTPTSTNPRGSI